MHSSYYWKYLYVDYSHSEQRSKNCHKFVSADASSGGLNGVHYKHAGDNFNHFQGSVDIFGDCMYSAGLHKYADPCDQRIISM